MRTLTIEVDFPYYHKGYERREYIAGQEVETDDDEFADVATHEGWATELKSEESAASAPEAVTAPPAAPEAAAVPAAPETKPAKAPKQKA